jgi:hypothetical protein
MYKKEKTCIVMDVAIPTDGNVIQRKRKRKEIENLYVDTKLMWYMKCVCTGNNCSSWNGKKRFKERLASHTTKQSIDSLQRTAILGT